MPYIYGYAPIMQITISTSPIDKIASRNLALGLFSDERPPRGAGGLIDWRLNGLISREIIRGRITGGFQEACVLFYPERIKAEAILFYGLGDTRAITRRRLYEAGRDMTSVMIKMFRPDFTLNIPTPSHTCLDVAAITEALLTGCFEAISAPGAHPGDIPSLVISQASLDEAVTGVNRFKKNHNIVEELLVHQVRIAY